ncbi:SIR2 family NAD-dependent protein deacylase [Rhizobium ecuadorense]|uniref:SIR2 family NAD-dependent protein deacylase n=1 Tax=Rhizobium ecuadorense TaxID=1671795 RepID=UPI000673A125|nr:SIR2 family protein [Rhizobium ecuadorense]
MIKWPTSLVQSIARRRAVILIGSGVSANAVTDAGAHPPTWGAFLDEAHGKLGKKLKHITTALKRYNYLEACEYLKQAHGAGWGDLIRGSFLTPNYKPADIHRAIFDLDCRIVASLNFDKVYESYAMLASEGTIIIKNYYDDDVRQVVAGADRYIMKPHGSVDTLSKMIFTLEDYGRARTIYSTFYEIFTSLLHTHTFLCIGCGLSDPDMQLIFEDYRYKLSESPHFITLPTPVSDAECSLIQKTRGLNVLTYSPRDNHKELTESLVTLGAQVAMKRDEIADLRSW